MSNPACKFPKILFKGNNAINQGYIKSGDLGGHFDLHINANKLKVFKFLSLKINGESIWQIIDQKNIQSICDRFLVDEKKARGWVEKFSSCLNSQDDRTNTFVRQVYFPTENSYHQLSILQPSGLIFSLKEKIDDINSRSCNAFLGRKAKKDNKFYRPGFSSVPNLTITKHGGDHPKNISALNNKYQTYFLLGSSPPHLEKRDIRFPTRNFFVESIRYYDVREPLNKLHHIFQADSNSDIPRRNLESGRDQHILAVFDAVIERMAVLRQVAEEQFREDSSLLDHYQKVWLCPGFETERAEANDWLDQLCKKITDWLLDAYKKTVKKALVLGAAEVSHIQQLIESHREVLR